MKFLYSDEISDFPLISNLLKTPAVSFQEQIVLPCYARLTSPQLDCYNYSNKTLYSQCSFSKFTHTIVLN